jgi:prepilin signal peptidase PulO-like enzyme (type II secretory pathway)
MALAATLLAFAPGLAAGGLLNAVRFAAEDGSGSGFRPGCSRCGYSFGIPQSSMLLSYLLRRRTCSHCGLPRRLRRPMLEVATGLLSVACFAHFGLSGRAFVAAALCAVLLVLAAIDVECGIIPNAIVVPAGGLIFLADIAVAPERALEWTLAAFGSMIGLLVLALVYRGALGMGDVKLGFLVGAGLGKAVLAGFLIGMCAAAGAAAVILFTRGFGARKHTFPLGPFLAAGAIAALFLS